MTLTAAEAATLLSKIETVAGRETVQFLRAIQAGDFFGAGGVTASLAEINVLDGVTSSTDELNILDGVTATAAELNITDGVTATAAEINKAADVSDYVQVLTASGAIAATTRHVELNHISVVIAATYTVIPNTIMIIKDTSASGTAAHTVTLTSGTFNGTNTVATLNARDEFLMVHFDSAGRGQVIANVGSVALS